VDQRVRTFDFIHPTISEAFQQAPHYVAVVFSDSEIREENALLKMIRMRNSSPFFPPL